MEKYGLILLVGLVVLGVLVLGGALVLLTRRGKRPTQFPPAGYPPPVGAGIVAPPDAGATFVQRGAGPAPATGWQLVVVAGQGAGRSYPLGMRTRLGRASNSEVRLSDGLASREHALIEWRENGYVISDLGSSNGTSVNGARLAQPRWLGVGDLIQIGGTQLAVQAFGPGAPAAGAPYVSGRMPLVAGVPSSPMAPVPTMPGAAPRMEQGGCLSFKVLLYLVGWLLLWVIVATGLYLYTREPLALAGVGLAALISLIFMVISLSSSWYGQIVEIRVERVRVSDSDGDSHLEDQEFAYIRQPNKRKPRRMRSMPGWEVGDWLEKRRGETNIRVRTG
jgi:hypothetical protein